jgi:hypothetical protein
LEQTQAIDGFLPIVDHEATTFRQPCQRSFHHPSSSRIGFLPMRIKLFLANTPNMRNILVGGDGLLAGGIAIFLPVRDAAAAPPSTENAPPRCSQAWRPRGGILDVGSNYGRAQRSALGFHNQAALHPYFPRSVGRRSTMSPHAGFAPGGVGPLPLPVQPLPTCHGSRPARHRGVPKCRVAATAGSGEAPCCRPQSAPGVNGIGPVRNRRIMPFRTRLRFPRRFPLDLAG